MPKPRVNSPSTEAAPIAHIARGSFIDTANCYDRWCPQAKGGESEITITITIGRWLRERGLRERLFIATKVGFGYGDVPDGLAASTIIAECEK